MKFKKAIAGSLLGLALGIGVATAGAATAQADEGRRIGRCIPVGHSGAVVGLSLLAVPGVHNSGRSGAHE